MKTYDPIGLVDRKVGYKLHRMTCTVEAILDRARRARAWLIDNNMSMEMLQAMTQSRATQARAEIVALDPENRAKMAHSKVGADYIRQALDLAWIADLDDWATDAKVFGPALDVLEIGAVYGGVGYFEDSYTGPALRAWFEENRTKDFEEVDWNTLPQPKCKIREAMLAGVRGVERAYHGDQESRDYSKALMREALALYMAMGPDVAAELRDFVNGQ